MYYVTIRTEGHTEIPASLAEILRSHHCTVDGYTSPMTVGYPNTEAASGLVSALGRTDLAVKGIEISGKKPIGASLSAASDD